VFYGKETPVDVFIKYYYLPGSSKLRLPNWVVMGFKLWLEKQGEDQPVDATILAKLRELLEAQNITSEDIEVKAKEVLKNEWLIE